MEPHWSIVCYNELTNCLQVFFVFAFQAMFADINLVNSKTHVVNSMQKVYFYSSFMQLKIIRI